VSGETAPWASVGRYPWRPQRKRGAFVIGDAPGNAAQRSCGGRPGGTTASGSRILRRASMVRASEGAARALAGRVLTFCCLRSRGMAGVYPDGASAQTRWDATDENEENRARGVAGGGRRGTADDGFLTASALSSRFPKLGHRDLVRLRGRAVRGGLLLERRGPDGQVYLALTSEGWRALRSSRTCSPSKTNRGARQDRSPPVPSSRWRFPSRRTPSTWYLTEPLAWITAGAVQATVAKPFLAPTGEDPQLAVAVVPSRVPSVRRSPRSAWVDGDGSVRSFALGASG
jgi:hypothetical protein